MNKLFLLSAVFMFLAVSVSAGDVHINVCTVLNGNNTHYVLDNNVGGNPLTGFCFDMTGENSSLDCSHFTVNYSWVNSAPFYMWGIKIEGFNDSVYSCNFNQTNIHDNTYGIYVDGNSPGAYGSAAIAHNTVVSRGGEGLFIGGPVVYEGATSNVSDCNFTDYNGGYSFEVVDGANYTNFTRVYANSRSDFDIADNVTLADSVMDGRFADIESSWSTIRNVTFNDKNESSSFPVDLLFIDSNYVTVSNSTFNNVNDSSSWDFLSGISANNLFINDTFNSSTKPTMVSFTYNGTFDFNSSESIADPSGYKNISKYLNVSSQDNYGWTYINMSYSHSDIPAGVGEASLRLWSYDADLHVWTPNTGSGVDTVNNYVYGNVSMAANQSFVVAPLGYASSINWSSSMNANKTQMNQTYLYWNCTFIVTSWFSCKFEINGSNYTGTPDTLISTKSCFYNQTTAYNATTYRGNCYVIDTLGNSNETSELDYTMNSTSTPTPIVPGGGGGGGVTVSSPTPVVIAAPTATPAPNTNFNLDLSNHLVWVGGLVALGVVGWFLFGKKLSRKRRR